MTQTATIGIAAGVLTAVLFAALLTFTPLGIAAYLITPLPAFVAGLAQGQVGALVAIASAAVLLLLAVHPALALSYAAVFGLPCLLLVRQTMTGAPQGASAAGRILAVAVVMAGGFGAANVLMLGPDEAAYRDSLGKAFDFYRQQLDTATGQPISAEDSAVLRDVVFHLLPGIAAISWLAITTFSLWLAGRLVRARKSLAQSLPDLAGLELPGWTLFTFMASLLAAYLGSGQLALVASAFAAAHGAGYLVQGLALIHRLTLGRPFRPGILIAVYVALVAAGYYVAFLIITFALAAPVLGWGSRPPASPLNTQT